MNTSTSTIKRAPIILTFLLPIVMLAMPTIPAWAAGSDSAPISMASVRSFPKRPIPHRSFSEAVSTDVDGSWGGIETLDVPHTESPEEQATRIQAEQARQSQAASRAEPRTPAATPVISAPTTGDKERPDSDTASALVSYALQYQGAPYMYGGNTPAGWDCSGFTQYVYARFGIHLPHPSGMQATVGTPVTDPQPGDLMANAGHAGIYIGNGLMIHAMNPVDGTKVTAVMPGMGYYRLLG